MTSLLGPANQNKSLPGNSSYTIREKFKNLQFLHNTGDIFFYLKFKNQNGILFTFKNNFATFSATNSYQSSEQLKPCSVLMY